MSGTVYAIASGKGGVGKTTTAVNVGAALGRADERVAVVDADLGMANLTTFVGLEPGATTLHDVLAGEASVDAATYRLGENLVAVPSGLDLEGYAGTSPEGLGAVVETLAEEYAYVLVDVGAGVSHETVLPLGLSDAVVVVSTPDPAAVRDAEKTLEVARRAGSRGRGLVVTRVREGDDPESIADRVGLDLLGAVPDDPAVRESVSDGRPVVVSDPDGPAARAYVRVAARLAGLEVPPDDRPAPGRAAPSEDDASNPGASDDDVSAVIEDAENPDG